MDDQCLVNPGMMNKECPVTCGVCSNVCEDKEPACKDWAKDGECEKNEAHMLATCPSACGLCSQLERFYRTGSEAAESHHTRDSTRSPDALPECRHRRREGRAMSTARSSAARRRRFGGRAQGECGDPRLAVCICRWWVASWTGPLVFSLRVRRHRVSRAVARGGRADHQTHIQSLTLSRLVSLVGCRGVAMTHDAYATACARVIEREDSPHSAFTGYQAGPFVSCILPTANRAAHRPAIGHLPPDPSEPIACGNTRPDWRSGLLRCLQV